MSIARGTHEKAAQTREKRKLPDDWSGTATTSNQKGRFKSYCAITSAYPIVETEEDEIAAEPEVKKSKNDFTSVYNAFVATYKAMTPESKFVFSHSGRVLEDVIYDNARTLSKKGPVHQWVLDLGDEDVLSWFSKPGELDELRSRIIPLPDPDKVFVASMARFADVCTDILSRLAYPHSPTLGRHRCRVSTHCRGGPIPTGRRKLRSVKAL